MDEGTSCRQPTPARGVEGTNPAHTTSVDCHFKEGGREILVLPREEWIAIVLALTATVAGAYAPIDDTFMWRKVLLELGFDTKIVERTYNGRQYVIVTGREGLRSVLKGRWYRADNLKVVRLALGRAGLVKGAIKGSVVTLVLVVGHDILEAVLSDDATLKDLLPYTVAFDVAKTVVASLVAFVIAAVAVGTAPAWAVIGGAIVVGVIVGKALDTAAPTEVFARKLRNLIDGAMASGGAFVSEFERQLTRMLMQQAAPFHR